MKKFEAGKKYEWYQDELGGFEVLKRTNKSIVVTNGQSEWRMFIHTDIFGYEWVGDSSVPKDWSEAFTSCASWEAK